MKTVSTFQHDRWAPKPATDLEVGELISHGGQVATVTALPYEDNGVTHVPAKPYDPGPLKLLIGEFAEGKEHIIMASDLVGSDIAEFDDGTALITDLEAGHCLVYSPRLPLQELEAFCAKHIERYQAFYEVNEKAIENRLVAQMEPWWF